MHKNSRRERSASDQSTGLGAKCSPAARLAVGSWQLQDQEHSAGSPGLIIQLHVQSRCKGAHSRTVRRSASPVQLYI